MVFLHQIIIYVNERLSHIGGLSMSIRHKISSTKVLPSFEDRHYSDQVTKY